ncbi:MAG: leucine-rich repeat protein [Clostridia bacterium]
MKKSAKLMITMLLVVLLVVTLVACGDKGTKYTISFESNGGSAIADAVVDGKSEIYLPESTKDGYICVGWFLDNDTFQIPFNLAYITANPTVTSIKVYAKWSVGVMDFEATADGGVAVKYYRGYETNVVIPSEYNGKIVTSIADHAFSVCRDIASITIPNTVKSIGESAFINCSGLTSIDIPASVTSIGIDAFAYCTGLTSIVIPASVTSLGERAISYCRALTAITVDAGNTKYNSAGNCLIETATNTLIAGCKNSVIPASVTSITSSAFAGCKGLTSVTIPSSVTSIGEGAFGHCSGLASITIPSTVTSVGSQAFFGCTVLTTINCKAASQPSGWVSDWNDICSANIVWGYTGA